MRIRLALSFAAVYTLILTSGAPVHAQDEVDPQALLQATYELHEGGRPLRRALFAQAWPTTAPYRLMTDRAGEQAEALLSSYLAGSLGPSLASSQWALQRKELRNKEGDSFDDTRALLGSELLLLRYLTDLRADTDGLQPTLYPLEKAKRAYARSRSEQRLGTWGWRAGSGKATLGGLGAALLVEARFGVEQLRLTREVQQAGKSVTLRGAEPESGFFGLLALQAAGAKAIELQRRLVYDSRKGEILRQTQVYNLDPRRFYFPNAWTAAQDGEVLAYSAPDDRSSLGAQSTLLLAVSTLARELGSEEPLIKEALRPLQFRGQKIYLVDPEAQEAAIDVAVFTFRAILTLHVSLASGAGVASDASSQDRGSTVTPADLALFVQALEAFARIPQESRGRNRELGTKLSEEQDKARKLGGALVKNLVQWVRRDREGVFDKYDIDTNSRASSERSLAGQAYAIQGLIAGHGLGDFPDALQAARELTATLDAKYWNPSVRAYVTPGRKGILATEAAAVLGALRRVALATGDGRYLYRYREYLAQLNQAGWFEPGSNSAPPALSAEIQFPPSK